MLLRFLLDGKTYLYRLDKRWLGFRPNYLNGPACGGSLLNKSGPAIAMKTWIGVFPYL